MAFSKLAASSHGRSSRTYRQSIRTYDFFASRTPRPRFFTHKPSLLVVARPILRPQLPFLYPFSRGNTLQTHVGRFISTERKQRWKEQFWRYVRINAYLWPAALLLTILSMGMVHTKLERDYPTPGDWSFWSRWWMREAKFTELADGAKVNQILTDWAKAGRLYLGVLERLESEKVDGQFLIKHAEKQRDTAEGFDVNAKSEQWRRGYHEALMGAARVAEHLEGMCKLKGDTGGGRVYPWESIPSPDNPRPKPLPYDRKYGHISPPALEEVEDAFPPPSVFYEKILGTAGFDTRQRLDAALAYADWCDFKGNNQTAEGLYVKAAEIAQSGLPAGTTAVIDVQSGMILKGREDAVSDNILRVCTAFGVHQVRDGNVKKALPVFLSVLRARKNLPASPLGPAIGPSRVKMEKDDSWLSYVYALKDLLVERPYPPPPPTGNDRPYHTLKEACEEVGLMTYIGEILFATSASERAKGLSWTRDSVEAAEAIMWVMDEQKEQDGRDRCRECLETGLHNWKAMAQQMARLAAKKEQEVESGKGLFGLGLGRPQQLEKARTERRRWDEENLQVELRRQKTLPLLQEPLQPASGGWLSTRVGVPNAKVAYRQLLNMRVQGLVWEEGVLDPGRCLEYWTDDDLIRLTLDCSRTSCSAIAIVRRRRRPDTITDISPSPSPNVNDLEAGEVRMEFRLIPLRMMLRRRVSQVLLLLLVVCLVMRMLNHYGVLPGRYLGLSACINVEFGYNPSTASVPAFEPPENSTYRAPDTIDTFQNYAWRNHSKCQISALDLHAAFSPLCATREAFLQAFSGGGRIGFDRPFIPLACDMRWFTTEEVCEIFSRFEKVIVVGDSMMRHVVGALNVLLRKDLGYGAVTNWNFNDQELQDCFCNHQMDVKSCSVQGIFSTSSVQEHDPSSLACPHANPIDLVIEMMLRFPLDSGEVKRYRDLLSPTKPAKPYAFVFGHGLWNDLDLGATLNWLDGILEHTLLQAPYLSAANQRHAHSVWPRLFITPNAAGIRKPDQWLVSQGDKALMIFEDSVRIEAASRGVDAMGTWNMSVQAEKYDGVHLDLKGNLVKAMGVVNWLNLVDVAAW